MIDTRILELILLGIIAVGVWSLSSAFTEWKNNARNNHAGDTEEHLKSLTDEVRKIKYRVTSLAKEYNEFHDEENLEKDGEDKVTVECPTCDMRFKLGAEEHDDFNNFCCPKCGGSAKEVFL